MWGSVLGPHTQTHFPTPPPLLSPHANTLPYSPHTLLTPLPTHLSLPPLHTFLHLPPLPHTSSHSSLHLPLHPNTLPTHPMHSPIPPSISSPAVSIMWRRYHVMMLYYFNKFYWNSPIKFFTTTWKLNILFRCRQCKFSKYESVAKLPCGRVTVAKLLATMVSIVVTAVSGYGEDAWYY